MSELSAADLWVYDDLVQVLDAERVAGSPAATPEQIEAALTVLTGDRRKAQVAAAKARLSRAARQKGF